jgi:hypothetical protein
MKKKITAMDRIIKEEQKEKRKNKFKIMLEKMGWKGKGIFVLFNY